MLCWHSVLRNSSKDADVESRSDHILCWHRKHLCVHSRRLSHIDNIFSTSFQKNNSDCTRTALAQATYIVKNLQCKLECRNSYTDEPHQHLLPGKHSSARFIFISDLSWLCELHKFYNWSETNQKVWSRACDLRLHTPETLPWTSASHYNSQQSISSWTSLLTGSNLSRMIQASPFHELYSNHRPCTLGGQGTGAECHCPGR